MFLILAIYMLCTLKDMHKSEHNMDSPNQNRVRSVRETASIIWEMSRNSRAINLSYYGSLVARMGDVVYIVFLNLWISSFYTDTDSKSDLDEAKVQSQMISGIGGVIILLFSFCVGWGSDKVSFKKSLTLIYGSRALFGMLVNFATDPHSGLAFAALLLGYVFNGFVNIIIGSYFYKAIKQDFRGIVNGLFLFFGTIGVILISKLGAYFFYHFGIGSPFMLCA